MRLPEHRTKPQHLATKTDLRKAGLVPTGDPVALYVYRNPQGGLSKAPLYERDTARNARQAELARRDRMARIHGQDRLL